MVNLPSKKVFLVAILSTVFLVSSIIYTNSSENETIKGFLKNIIKNKPQFSDSDNDGISDWEENLFKTNAFDNDSDNDGISDGKELTSYKSISYTKPSDSIFNYLNNLGKSVIEDSTSSLTLKPTFYPDRFSKDDIAVINTNNITVSMYVSEMLNVLNDYVDVLEKEPLTIIKHWLDTSDESDLKELAYISSKDKELADRLAKVEVPSDLIEVHLSIMNNLYKGAQSLDDVEITVHDPTAGFFTAANYANYRSKRTESIFILTKYFSVYTASI